MKLRKRKVEMDDMKKEDGKNVKDDKKKRIIKERKVLKKNKTV